MFEPLVTFKDWQDQLIHAACGAFLTFAFQVNIGLLAAAVLTMCIAVARESLYQHWMACGVGCRTDLMGWLVGVLLVSLFV